MSSKAVVSLIAALAISVSGIVRPVAALAAEEGANAAVTGSGNSLTESDSVLSEEVKASGYYAALAAVSLLKQAGMILGDPVVAAAAADVKKAADTAASLSGLPIQAGASAEDDESLWYCPGIPMKKEHQKLLWECCRERGLDYIDMLALIALESNFQEKCSNGKYKGYFQISSDHGTTLSRQLNTKNDPLDGTVNIIWGTAFFSWIMDDERVKGLEGKEKRDVALSIYQRGPGGYDKYGKNKKYLEKYYKKRDMIVELFENR
ncbi:MAG TPA: hypothetical protein PK767_10105 [Clostridiales bacterium]|nr:hypothetical protein [Clostridiales bacterium]HPP36578.1 hypothetical protein [Clostridiales bacterium]